MDEGRLVVGVFLTANEVPVPGELEHDMIFGPTSVQTRNCPDMHGVPMQYIGDGMYVNPITGQVYDFRRGFRLGDKEYLATSIEEQHVVDSPLTNGVPHDVYRFKRER
jgi:hypothetical protein